MKGTIRRYFILIEKIGRKGYPSFSQLKEYLSENDIEVSDRTIQRDIEQIRFEFGIDIRYHRNHNGYFIDTETSIDIDSFMRFLEIVITAELFTDSLKESKKTLNYISFESNGELRGTENLKPILLAVKNHREIQFEHENFESGILRKYIMQPYLIKEYQKRWYVIGKLNNLDEIRTLGIDRISSLKIVDHVFEPPAIDVKGLFTHTIGLVYSFNEPEEVILSFTPLQGKYIKTLPLHHSQETIIDNDEELRVKLFIIPNFEFKQKVLMMGDSVKILQPEWFAKEVKETLLNAFNNYKE